MERSVDRSEVVLVDPQRDLLAERERGFLICPWAPDEFEPCPVGLGGRATANRFTITGPAGRLSGYELSAHLIRHHAFFGGPVTRSGWSPSTVARALGLLPGT